uniref:Uncharacterized protein n=1 Tax=Steinernema glaseri TaxID=37863 RepID=A0A1I7ZS58_9BILA
MTAPGNLNRLKVLPANVHCYMFTRQTSELLLTVLINLLHFNTAWQPTPASRSTTSTTSGTPKQRTKKERSRRLGDDARPMICNVYRMPQFEWFHGWPQAIDSEVKPESNSLLHLATLPHISKTPTKTTK